MTYVTVDHVNPVPVPNYPSDALHTAVTVYESFIMFGNPALMFTYKCADVSSDAVLLRYAQCMFFFFSRKTVTPINSVKPRLRWVVC